MIYDDPEFNCGYASLCPDGPWHICQNCIYHPLNFKEAYDENDDNEDDE